MLGYTIVLYFDDFQKNINFLKYIGLLNIVFTFIITDDKKHNSDNSDTSDHSNNGDNNSDNKQQ